jgi:hypothetical protein
MMVYVTDNNWDLAPAVTGCGARSEANAAFIVKCVNSHDALVKALTDLRNKVSGCLSAYDPDLRQAMGNTNVAVMQDRVANADRALASIKERA